MSKKTKLFLYIIAGIFLFSVMAYILSSSITSDIKDLNDPTQNNENSEQVSINEVIITETRDGVKFWEIYAKNGRYENGNSKAKLTDIIGNFYKDSKVVMSFMADEGIYSDKSKAIHLTKGSKISTDKNISINSDELIWSGSEDNITAKGNVIVNKENKVITFSNIASFNSNFTKLKLSGKTKINMYE